VFIVVVSVISKQW